MQTKGRPGKFLEPEHTPHPVLQGDDLARFAFMAEDAIGKVRKRTAAQSHSQEQPRIPDPLDPRPPTPPSPSLPPPAQPLWSWCRARAATVLSKVRSPAAAKNITDKSRQASEADSKRSIATCAALALAVFSKEINLSAQPERWETLGKL